MGHNSDHQHHHPDLQSDQALLTSAKGIRAVKLSFLGLIVTALFQAVIVYFTGSTALLADTLHNFADAFSAFPLWLAFLLGRRRPDRRFTYGYQRLEDLAGIFIVLLIFGTAIVIGIDSLLKIKEGTVVRHLPWVVGAAIIGYLGNELVARYRIHVGKEINSPALVADGYHARADAYTSLGVLASSVGVYFGFPIADPLVGFIIAILIVKIGWTSGKDLFVRLADAISPENVKSIEEIAGKVEGVLSVQDIRARYTGRDLRVELTITVDKSITVLKGHEIAIHVQHKLQEAYPEIVSPGIHVDPEGHQGEAHHFEAHHREQ